DRFLTILQTLIIWINAKELGVTCTEEIPESIRTYIGIMKMHFDIDFEYLLK
ncbi:MAG: SAM-dependent methyltransferase, partial [Nitrosopumilus sp.]